VTPVYAAVLACAILALLVWVGLSAIAATVDGWGHVDPEERYGRGARLALAGTAGFGLAGVSATFAGWAAWATLVAACGGAMFAVGVAYRYGPQPQTESENESMS
jgi:hypothetical protein